MDLAEDFIQYVIKYTMDKCPEDLNFGNTIIGRREIKTSCRKKRNGVIDKLNFVLENNFKRFVHEAIDILRECTPNKKKKFNYIINEWGADLQSEHEALFSGNTLNVR
jgi:asparaginyl-tRNA synthetase